MPHILPRISIEESLLRNCGLHMVSSRFRSQISLLAILLMLVYFAPARPVTAQEDDVSELISLINQLRASAGLAPYIVDPGLMALAQEHSEYQASIHTSTHQHSDGRDPPDIGVVENVAGGDLGYLDPQAAVYEIWADPVHQRTMLGYPEGWIGVGIADDGVTTYYTLDVRPAGSVSGNGTAPALLTPIPLVTLVPATPLPDGSIVHIVGYGQTLWAIALAYGVQVEQIRAWNNLAADSNDIYAGQHLLVLPANLAAASPTLPADPGTGQEEGVAVSMLLNTVEGTLTVSPPANTPTVTDLAVLVPTDIETQAGIQADSKDSLAESGLLAPFLAGGSLLIGSALLLILRINKKLS